MFETIKEQLKEPVATVLRKAAEEDLQKGFIKTAIISGILSFINVILSIVKIIKSSFGYYYSSLSKAEQWERRWSEIEDAELISGFFKTWVMVAIVMAVLALILLVIAKLVKNKKEYANTLSMINSVASLCVIGNTLNVILTLIYVPLGILVSFATFVYAGLTLINAYRDSLDLENTDTLVLVTTGVLTVFVVIVAVLIANITKTSLSDITSLLELLDIVEY